MLDSASYYRCRNSAGFRHHCRLLERYLGHADVLTGDNVVVVVAVPLLVMPLLTAVELRWCCHACGP